MGNSASLNETINARLSQLESIDINFSKSLNKYSSNSSNKCSACQSAFHFVSFKKRRCVNCLEYYCPECATHYKDNMYICYRCHTFMSPDFGWDELMKLKSKDLVWYLNRRNISCSDCKEKEQLVEMILERFRIPSNISNVNRNIQTENQATNVSVTTDFGSTDNPESTATNSSIPDTSNKSCPNVCNRRCPPPSYEEVIEGGYPSSPNNRNERVPIEEITSISDIELLSIKQLKDMLAYNKVDYKGCVERHELVSRVERLWLAFNNDRILFASTNSDKLATVKECAICMDKPVDCVLIECGHMLCCVRCGSKLAECPICRQNVVRCIRVFPAQ